MENSSHPVIIWKIRISQFYDSEAYYLSLLNDQEKLHAHSLVTRELTSRYVIAQGILRRILGNYLSIKPKKIEFAHGPHNKPFLADNHMRLQFNMSRSHDLVLIGFSFEDEIGIDVELCDAQVLENGIEKAVSFFCAWTHKEALQKLAGFGTLKEPKEIEVPLHLVNEPQGVIYEGAERYLRSFLLDGSYVAAVASTKPSFEILIQNYERDG